MKLPTITILAGRAKRAGHGYPWVFSNEIQMDQQAKAIEPGSLVKLKIEGGPNLGIATFNPHTLIAARRLEADENATIDVAWFAAKFRQAQAVRARFLSEPYYRLVHAEADGLPGLIVDRHGDVVTLQANTAGMDKLLPEIITALKEVTGAKAIVLNRAGAAVVHEGLKEESRVIAGELSGQILIRENGITYCVDPVEGQKTGWFYDQRDNRAFVAKLAKDARVFDGYCYAGGFGLLSAHHGAREVVLVDQSAGALALAEKAATFNKLAQCRFVKADVMAELEKQAAAGEKYDVVIVDPPAFIKAKKDIAAGLKGYRKLTRLAAALVAPGGTLAIFSCSHHAEPTAWAAEIARGLGEAKRTGRIVYTSGAGIDHPLHPLLPESAYLKAQVLVLD